MDTRIKVVIQITVIVFFLGIAFYATHLYVMPKIVVLNDSNDVIQFATVQVPSSSLDFGSIDKNQQNTIQYSLKQADGAYQYTFMLKSGQILSGECGYVTANEIHKRVILHIKTTGVVCSE